MAERSKNIALFVFLIFLFIFLAVIIFVFLYSSYTSTANYSVETTRTSVECASYTFRIVGGSLNYENGTLSFVFDPSLGRAREPNALVINTTEGEAETTPIKFTFKQRIRIKIPPVTQFQVYPKGCPDIIRNCDLDDNRCK